MDFNFEHDNHLCRTYNGNEMLYVRDGITPFFHGYAIYHHAGFLSDTSTRLPCLHYSEPIKWVGLFKPHIWIILQIFRALIDNGDLG